MRVQKTDGTPIPLEMLVLQFWWRFEAASHLAALELNGETNAGRSLANVVQMLADDLEDITDAIDDRKKKAAA